MNLIPKRPLFLCSYFLSAEESQQISELKLLQKCEKDWSFCNFVLSPQALYCRLLKPRKELCQNLNLGIQASRIVRKRNSVIYPKKEKCDFVSVHLSLGPRANNIR